MLKQRHSWWSTLTYILKIRTTGMGAGKDGSVLRALVALAEDQNPHSGSQSWLATPVPRELMPSSDLCRLQAHTWCTDILTDKKTHLHNKRNLKFKTIDCYCNSIRVNFLQFYYFYKELCFYFVNIKKRTRNESKPSKCISQLILLKS